MIRFLAIIFTGILCSMYIFPFTFTFFPVGNTKIYMAVLGVLLFIVNSIRNRNSATNRSMIYVSLAALAVSIVGIISVFYNETNDYAYAQYIISMWVWAGAAYFVVQMMKKIHGNITVELIGKYIIGVCVAQCCFALMNEFIPAFKNIVDAYVEQQTEFLNRVERMYGIGASLDTAGSRFACSLIMLAYIMTKYAKNGGKNIVILFYVLIFVFITVVGNMIARTTIAGVAIAFGYFLYTLKDGFNSYQRKILYSFVSIAALAVPVIIYLYATSPEASNLFSYAFESFFNLAEEGKLETHSTNELLDMWTKIPEQLKTWIIGDGYFVYPYIHDPYYIGDQRWAYYMGTDVGYLRFIYYFGIIGLLTFFYFFVCCTRECSKKYSSDKVLFVLLLIMNMVLWAKVATDLFFIFALFLLADYVDDRSEESSPQPKPAITQ